MYYSLSRVWLSATPQTIACQASLSMKFSRQEYWSGWPFPSPGALPNPGIKPRSPALQADSLLIELWRKTARQKIHRKIAISPPPYYCSIFWLRLVSIYKMLCCFMFSLQFTKIQVKEKNLLTYTVNVPDGPMCFQYLDFTVLLTSWQLKFHESHWVNKGKIENPSLPT